MVNGLLANWDQARVWPAWQRSGNGIAILSKPDQRQLALVAKLDEITGRSFSPSLRQSRECLRLMDTHDTPFVLGPRQPTGIEY